MFKMKKIIKKLKIRGQFPHSQPKTGGTGLSYVKQH